MRKLSVILVLVVLLNLCAGIAVPAKSEAFYGLAWDVLNAAVEYLWLKELYKDMEYNSQAEVYSYLKKEQGVSRSDAAGTTLHRISSRLQAAPGNDEIRSRPPKIFVNTQQDFNAARWAGNVISINEGVFAYCRYNEDMVAFVVAHEMAHGTQQHFLRKMDALIGYDVAKRLYAKRYEIEVSRLDFLDYAARQVQANGYSIPHEWEADNVGFNYTVAAGYNPGAGAAAFTRVIGFLGEEKSPSLTETLLSPRSHPPVRKRIENFSKRLTEYSNNTVSVTGATVNVKGQPFFTAQTMGDRLGEERAFLVAGNLARVLRQNPKPAEGATVDYGTVRLAGQHIVAPGPGEPVAEELQDKLNRILAITPATPPAQQSVPTQIKPQNSRWVTL